MVPIRLLILCISAIGRIEGFLPLAGTVRDLRRMETAMTNADAGVELSTLSVRLEKPLGMILEEVEEGAASGVYVKELSEEGSAYASEFKEKLQGLKLATVMGKDCSALDFDSVMDELVSAPSPVDLEFFLGAEADDGPSDYDVGTIVTIRVLEDGGKETEIQAAVGENLRQVLLENNIEVYKGLKNKLGNCGGGGQCTFCAADFVESDGWSDRSDYEDKKLKRSPTARLTCLNNIQGPATIRI